MSENIRSAPRSAPSQAMQGWTVGAEGAEILGSCDWFLQIYPFEVAINRFS